MSINKSNLSKLLPTITTVRRDGREQQIIADEIVPGDIILIRMGDKLPADCRFLVCEGLKVNILIRDSFPCRKMLFYITKT